MTLNVCFLESKTPRTSKIIWFVPALFVLGNQKGIMTSKWSVQLITCKYVIEEDVKAELGVCDKKRIWVAD